MPNAQMNVGKVGSSTKVDQWHFDSINFVGVVILSDIEDMVGGELEVLRCPRNISENRLLEKNFEKNEKDKLTVSYKSKGYCIAVQGSELCHHVTPVTKAKEDRISFIISFHPANPYHKGNTI